MSTEPEKRSFSSSNTEQPSDISKYIGSLYLNKYLSDVTFRIGSEELPAHKLILSSNRYFYKLLYGDFAETNANVIDLEVGLKPFKAVLKYIYCGHLELSELDVTEIVDILTVVHMFNIPNLTAKILSHLTSVISLSNACTILEVSRRLGFDSLTETCLSLLDISSSEFLLHDDFTTLTQVSY